MLLLNELKVNILNTNTSTCTKPKLKYFNGDKKRLQHISAIPSTSITSITSKIADNVTQTLGLDISKSVSSIEADIKTFTESFVPISTTADAHFGTQFITENVTSLFKTLTSMPAPLDVLSIVKILKDFFGGLSMTGITGELLIIISGIKATLSHFQRNISDDIILSISHGELRNNIIILITLISVIVAVAWSSDGYSQKETEEFNKENEYQVPKIYSPEAVEAYFANKQTMVWKRVLSVLASGTNYYLVYLLDKWTGKLDENEAQRAVLLRKTLEKMGPTYIKAAQAISTRADILSPLLFNQIQKLQDRVPPFDTDSAYKLLEEELGMKIEDIFDSLSKDTVASASLGQVYKGILKEKYGGHVVAVKAQRPNVLSQVALDLYVGRILAKYIMPQIQKTKTDYVALIDNWATRFFQEMDYEQEAKNTLLFREQMSSIEGIVVPRVFPELSTRKILMTEWIEGEKLIESSEPDVRELCNTLLNVYLVQLLDTGFLHADPHPGNLIRTPEGKICIIDFGLMTEISRGERDALVEYIANLTTANWKGVARSFKELGFIDASAPDPVELGIDKPLGEIFSQIVKGGGAREMRERIEKMPRLDEVKNQLEELGERFPFKIPTFFALIVRAFSVIEGIALRVDPKYSITMECFPYIAQRLLTDDDPRMNKILKGVLFGNKNHIDVQRLQQMADGIKTFTLEGIKIDRIPKYEGPLINATARAALEVLFSPKGSYLQDLIVDEMVSAADAFSRENLSRISVAYLESLPALLNMRTLEALGPLRPIVFPFLTPTEFIERLAPALNVTDEEKESLNVIRSIFSIVQNLDASDNINQEYSPEALLSLLQNLAQELSPMIPDLAPGVVRISELFVRRLASKSVSRIADALDAPSEFHEAMKALD